jgi:hypothetical protein
MSESGSHIHGDQYNHYYSDPPPIGDPLNKPDVKEDQGDNRPVYITDISGNLYNIHSAASKLDVEEVILIAPTATCALVPYFKYHEFEMKALTSVTAIWCLIITIPTVILLLTSGWKSFPSCPHLKTMKAMWNSI